ncbi:hypothetical protein OG241_18130 [Streptomyces sp. NBC_01390]|uniref:hypothetical protein n=1 Tax=Streptomyces sp. NBC_01390 TaxID=2903850 RepID=UPI00324B3EF0
MVTALLAQFQVAITDFQRRVDAEARAFVAGQLSHLYEEGARAAARAVGGDFSWTLIHREALQSLASDSYADFLRRSEEEQRRATQFFGQSGGDGRVNRAQMRPADPPKIGKRLSQGV